MLAMQQDTKKKEGPASMYSQAFSSPRIVSFSDFSLTEQDAKPGQSDLSLKSSDINEVVGGKVRGNEVPTQVHK